MKRVIFLLTAAFVLVQAYQACGKGPADFPRAKGYINDTAGVIEAGAAAEMEKLLAELEKKTTAEVVVATVKTTAPLEIEQFAAGLFEKWGIGKKGKDNGVLLLVAVSDRKVRIETGYGLEGDLTDLQCKVIIDDLMLPSFKQGDYTRGIFSGVIMITKIIRDVYGAELELDTSSLPDEKASGEEIPPAAVVLIIVLFILFAGASVFFGRGSSRGTGYGHRPGDGLGGGRSGGGGFGGFGGGRSGGGGAGGSW